jgi:hypothetical protein
MKMNLSLDEIFGDFSRKTVTAALQCAGNRRLIFLPLFLAPARFPGTPA